jgi:hypothetical protein
VAVRTGIMSICIGALTAIGVFGAGAEYVLGVRFSSTVPLEIDRTGVDGMLFPSAICVKGLRGDSVSPGVLALKDNFLTGRLGVPKPLPPESVYLFHQRQHVR